MSAAEHSPRSTGVPPEHRRRWLVWTLAIVLLVVSVVVVGPWLYVKVFRAENPGPLGLSSTSPSAPATEPAPSPPAPIDVNGSWHAVEGSQAGYRLAEVLSGQEVTAVGRTEKVTATIEVVAGVMTTAEVVVDAGSIATAESARDAVFRRALDTTAFPQATFTLTEPLNISAVSAATEAVAFAAAGTLSFHGITLPVTAQLDVQRTATGVEVAGTVPVVLKDFGLSAPDLPFVTVQPQGTVEMLLVLEH